MFLTRHLTTLYGVYVVGKHKVFVKIMKPLRIISSNGKTVLIGHFLLLLYFLLKKNVFDKRVLVSGFCSHFVLIN